MPRTAASTMKTVIYLQLFGADATRGASRLAGTAIDALIRINLVDIALADRLYWALVDT